MNKDKLKYHYKNLHKKYGPISREKFVELSGATRTDIVREYGTYTALKSTLEFEVEEIQQNKVTNKAVLKSNGPNDAIADVYSKRITTLEDLLSACKVDQNLWGVDNYVINKWEVGSKVDGKILVEPLYQVKAWLKKKVVQENFNNLLLSFIESAKNHSPTSFKYTPVNSSKKLLTLNLPDAHINKLCWAEETGHDNYNLKIAVEAFKETISNLISKASRYTSFERIMFIVGNDMLNSDNTVGTTTAGTPQDNDTRWFKSYKTACTLISEIVENLASICEVDVIMVGGNHDFHSCLTIGEYLQAWFRNNSRVHILNKPAHRTYYKYHNNAFCLTHGDGIKRAELPLIMATECNFWSECSSRELYLGHTHETKVTENKGVITRVFPSLSATDVWHGSKGYIGNKRVGQALVYDENGLDAIFEYEPNFKED